MKAVFVLTIVFAVLVLAMAVPSPVPVPKANPQLLNGFVPAAGYVNTLYSPSYAWNAGIDYGYFNPLVI